jgi:hypothetical protein
MLIRHSQALNGARHDTQFAIAAINVIKKYNPKYVLADKAYDSEKIRKQVNEKTTALAMIPLKKKSQNRKTQIKQPSHIQRNSIQF